MKNTITNKRFAISNRTLSLLVALAAIGSPTTAHAMFDDDIAIENIVKISNYIGTSSAKEEISESQYQIDSNVSVVKALESILEDARGTCIGSLRCAVALSVNSLIENSKFIQFGLDTTKVGDYALSISGDENKARMLFVADNKGNTEYIDKLVEDFSKTKVIQMEQKDNPVEQRIAENFKIAHIQNYTAVAINPHANESMEVMIKGLNMLIEAQMA